VRSMHSLYTTKENEYWTSRIMSNSGDSRRLWCSLSSLLVRDRGTVPQTSPHLTADKLAQFFVDKVTTPQKNENSRTATAEMLNFYGSFFTLIKITHETHGIGTSQHQGNATLHSITRFQIAMAIYRRHLLVMLLLLLLLLRLSNHRAPPLALSRLRRSAFAARRLWKLYY